jgi:integrase
MRRSEIASLEWKHLNLNKKTILIPVTKNGEAREVPLSEIALTQILQMNNALKQEYLILHLMQSRLLLEGM